MIQVFVYGTLQPGEVNYWVCANAVVEAKPAIVLGCLYHLPLGYPALDSGTQTVRGFLLSFANPAILSRLDEFERHDPIALQSFVALAAPHQYDYERQWIEVLDLEGRSLGNAWVYRMTIEQIRELGGVPLLKKQWNSRQIY